MEDFDTKICATCGKSFVVPYKQLWRFKKRDNTPHHFLLYYCSWGCMLKGEKRKEKKDEDHS